jgi:AcrR family transcriptional regulator
MNGFERRTEQKRESIRQAAVELFRTYGFSKVSVGDIAKKAHVSHVTIYNYFGGKEELIREIIKKVSTDLNNKALEIIESDKPFIEKVQLLMSSRVYIASMYQGELIKAIASDYPALKPFIQEMQDKYAWLGDKFIEEGKKAKYIKQDISNQAIKYFLQAFRSGLYMNKEVLEKVKIDEKLASDVIYLSFFGVIEKQD